MQYQPLYCLLFQPLAPLFYTCLYVMYLIGDKLILKKREQEHFKKGFFRS